MMRGALDTSNFFAGSCATLKSGESCGQCLNKARSSSLFIRYCFAAGRSTESLITAKLRIAR
jgi:hypothetical protein